MFVAVADGPKGRAIRIGVNTKEVDAMEEAASGLSGFAASIVEAMTGAGEIEALDPGAMGGLSEIAVKAATASAALRLLTGTLRGGTVRQASSEAELADGVRQTYDRAFNGDDVKVNEPVSAKDLLARAMGL